MGPQAVAKARTKSGPSDPTRFSRTNGFDLGFWLIFNDCFRFSPTCRIMENLKKSIKLETFIENGVRTPPLASQKELKT